MEEEHSAGAVVFHRGEKGIEYLVLHYEAGHWDFAKGHLNDSEDEMGAMLREVHEETGLEVRVVPGFRRSIDYVYRDRHDCGKLKHKTVGLFLAESSIKEVKLSDEHVGYAWLAYDAAQVRLTHDNAKSVLKDAHNYLNSFFQSKLK